MVDPHAAVVIITHLWNTDFDRWWDMYFFPDGKPWYEGLVWGNVFAVLPLGLLGTIGFFFHKWLTREHERFDSKTAHDERAKEARKLFDLLDPHTDGGIAEIHDHVHIISDKVDETTPGGLGTIRDQLDETTPGGIRAVLDEVRLLERGPGSP